ncbi:hypothetical protein C3481_06450 [Microbacterium sp. Ru50]|uniref:hypothetical protein n=1 Tax=Microbacterium sp. Ru50 TaxID=2080744 RepID=UPI000CDD4941|nr:hypothetical protein [Microbacterium sp. Ru50]POX67822.1 hypothetical protein C3481_06450 [Microbacterium sp. Ru50]
MDELGGPRYKRIRLTGERFEGGRLPIDSLVELQRYQEVVRKLAEFEWRREHPEDELPSDFADGVGLTIEKINDGSADVLLAFEQHETYVHYQAEARDAADATIAAAYAHLPLPELPHVPPALVAEVREELADIGGSLLDGQSIEFYADPSDTTPTIITVEGRREARADLILTDFFTEPEAPSIAPLVQKKDESLVGRVTAVDADSTKFELVTSQGRVHGWYRENTELLADLKAVLNTAEEGPLTRITGELRTKNGVPNRFWTTHTVELVAFDDSVSGRRLTEFAALPSGWEDGEGLQISFSALEAAQEIIRGLDARADVPGLFPTPEGGVLVEWASAAGVRSIEVLADGTFELFTMTPANRVGEHSETKNLSEAIDFARRGVA